MTSEQFNLNVFGIHSSESFNDLALKIFYYQYKNNPVYKAFVDGVCREIANIKQYQQIPCLPVEFYKTHHISSVDFEPQLIFHSSGTTGQSRSNNNIYSEEIYKESLLTGFNYFYGAPTDYIICALIPDYTSHKDSSLAYMLDYLIKQSNHNESGFYFGKEAELLEMLKQNAESQKIIFGITYALINFANQYATTLENTIIIETGGMKGKMKEMTRAEVHNILYTAFHSPIHSEYSMAELMSQAYLTKGNTFSTPPWMKITIREVNDPLTMAPFEKTGGINIIDLANYQTCSFISTKDLGILYSDGMFEVLGRFDFADIRGCNLLSAEL